MTLRVADVNAYYGNFHVLNGVSLQVEQGTIHTLLGRNGAGKTTTLRTIFGLMNKWTGTIFIDDEEISKRQPYEINRAGLAYVPEYRGIFSNLTVRENLAIAEPKQTDWPTERVLQLFPALQPLLGRKGGNLSGGEQQMLAIGRALMRHRRPGRLHESNSLTGNRGVYFHLARLSLCRTVWHCHCRDGHALHDRDHRRPRCLWPDYR